jgi:hypothetical protein
MYYLSVIIKTTKTMNAVITNKGQILEMTDMELDSKLDLLMGKNSMEADFNVLAGYDTMPYSVKTANGRQMTENGIIATEYRIKLIEKYGPETMSLYQIGGVKSVVKGFASSCPIFKMKKSAGCYGIEA